MEKEKEVSCCVTACERPLDQDYWNTQWLNQATGWDIGYATPALTQYIDGIEDKNAKILIPGCGSAHEAEYLAEKGFQSITLIDIAPEAVVKLQEKFKGNALVRVLQGDFFEHNEQYDFIIEQTFFCALPPFLRPKYVWKMHQMLNSNGKLFGLLFNRQFSSSPPFGGSKEEYEALFKGAFQFEPLQTAAASIPQRAGSELFIELQKNDSVVVEMYAFTGITCNGCMSTVQDKIKELDSVLNVQMSSDYAIVLVVSEKNIELQDLKNTIAYDAKYSIEAIK